ncbi:MAG: 16S rRNA methyltransferase [Anaerolineae bacterium]|nr:16S rRNA methyltransferase [Anaerolineae bacterium]
MNTSKNEQQLEQLVSAIQKSQKYRTICEDLIRTIGKRELSIRGDIKTAIKITKGKLHQVGGAYFEHSIDYGRALREFAQAGPANSEAFRSICLKLLRLHASTKERLSIIQDFYTTTLDTVKPVQTILDIACGLNPLAIPWMPLDGNARYYAYDVFSDMTNFIQDFMAYAGIEGQAECRDITQFPPTQAADVAFVLKTIPCLEQLDKGAGLQLLESLNAKYLVVSFPMHSLSGQNKGMLKTYQARFEELVQGKRWIITKFEFTTELAYLVNKSED